MTFGSANDATRLWAGGYHTCVRRPSGDLECAGRNGRGELGLGDLRADPRSPTVTRFRGVLESGTGVLCDLDNGRVHCAGDNEYGQVGDGHDPRVPRRVLRP